ncbi:PEP-CTERM sorting domain-containing protein [Roseofilum sp. BLCC_M91]|uniref:PEP-CTERM sorting domain-containing protein n=1 Tax=Roseofilum halophilum BLCC-M91 TaxID=3022259 RepID=A0ABT7BHU8_9CYAN|nr:PEP-CTERM sorting domain-containing protein [Roseofilum halophilum]MDJ1178071.1 PEP-CTERM sorting domain-containing protein [Roseofilum halophilum BLCC-M91]
MKLQSLPFIAATSMMASLCNLIVSLPAQANFTFSRIATTEANPFGSSYDNLGMGLGTQGGMSSYKPSSLFSEIVNTPQRRGVAVNTTTSTVAYYAEEKGIQGIYTRTGNNPPQLIIDTSATSGFKSIGQGMAINNKGTVAFFATKKNGETGIFTHDGVVGNPPKQIAKIGDPYTSIYPGVSINDDGTVAFLAAIPPSNSPISSISSFSRSEVFTSDGTTTHKITDCTGLGAGSQACPLIPTSPTINNDGDVGFASKNGIFTSSPGSPISVIMADQGGQNFWLNYYREPNINDNDLVSAYAHNAGPGQLIFSSNGVQGQMVVGNNFTTRNDPSTFLHVGTSAINNRDIVAFMANQIGVGKGIFIGADAQKDKVIGVGSTLNGAKVLDLAMDRESFNDNNEISFWARLDNGTQGIYRANKFGDSQFNPFMPNCVQNGATFSFCNAKPRLWYDPPSAYGFDYQMTSDSLFTEIMNLPVGFTDPFKVMVDNIFLGEFTAGDSVNFSDYAGLLGDLLIEGSGVKAFSVLGLNVDPSNPDVFPIKLDANTETISFDMYARIQKDSSDIPEPSALFGLILVGTGFLLNKGVQQRR